jgi:transketolase
MQNLLNWPHGAFEIPEPVVAAWRSAGRLGAEANSAWRERLDAAPDADRDEFRRRIAGDLPKAAAGVLRDLRRAAVGQPDIATRMASSQVLEALFEVMPELVGGSADLAGSTQTWPKQARAICAGDYGGRYIPYGVREHAMAAFMTGIALHGGFIPFGGTFLCFIDYARPAVRLAAMMEQREIFVMTHDCITVGEDGPTHQPVEHLAGLRATPNLNVFRPGDMIEALESWELALNDAHAPTVLCLSRNPLPILRKDSDENLTARGGYVLQEASGPRQATIFATGSELALAAKARETLESEGVATAVVSLPNWRLFDNQPKEWRDAVLGPRDAVAVAVEALSPMGWERYVGRDGIILSVDSFGVSAPAADVLNHFGFTPEAVAEAVRAALAKSLPDA